jgi:hypothetical protein
MSDTSLEDCLEVNSIPPLQHALVATRRTGDVIVGATVRVPPGILSTIDEQRKSTALIFDRALQRTYHPVWLRLSRDPLVGMAKA